MLIHCAARGSVSSLKVFIPDKMLVQNVNKLFLFRHETMTHRKTFRRWSTMKFICAAFVILMTSVGASSVNDCRGVKYAYSRKGLDQSDVPRQPRQGKKVF